MRMHATGFARPTNTCFRLPCCPPMLPWQVPMLRVLRNNWAGVCIQILLTAWCAPLLRWDEAR